MFSHCTRGVGGLRAEVEEMGEEPRSRGGMQVCRAPPKGLLRTPAEWIHCPLGSPSTLIPSNSRDCQESIRLCLWATTSIISPFGCLEWVVHVSADWLHSIIVIIKILNQFPNQYICLPIISAVIFCILFFIFCCTRASCIFSSPLPFYPYCKGWKWNQAFKVISIIQHTELINCVVG